MGSAERDPLAPSRGVLLAADFCRATGLDTATLTALVRSGRLEGLLDGAGRAFGLFDDALPTPEELRAAGLEVRADYDPDEHRSDQDDSDDPEEPGDPGWSWEEDHHPRRTPRTVDSVVRYASSGLSLREDQVRGPDGSVRSHAVVDGPDLALVIAADAGRLHLVEQYRYPVAGRCWEFPSGSADPDRDADPWALAARELREETGLVASTFETLGILDVTPSTLSQRCWVFLATGLTPGAPDRDDDELDMESGWFTRGHVEQMIADGYITDAKTCAAYALLLLRERRSADRTADPGPATA